MNEPSVFNFVSYSEFLRAASHRYLKRADRPFTAKEWAKRLGYKSPQALTMVLNGQRLPSSDMIFKLADDLQLAGPEKRYFELLVCLEKFRRQGKSIKSVVTELEDLNENFCKQQPLDAATFSYIADWYHLVIEQLIGTRNFREDTTWIRQRLRLKISEQEAKLALQTLLRLGLVRRNEASGILKRAQDGLATEIDVPSKAVRAHHKQMLERAAEALEEQAVEAREFISHGLRFDRSRIGEAKAAIRAFRDEFDKRFCAEANHEGDDVFQLNMQFFSHTD